MISAVDLGRDEMGRDWDGISAFPIGTGDGFSS